MHNLLKRQLKKAFGASFVIPEEWMNFIQMVDAAYHEFDIDRVMLERSLDLSSHELLHANSEIKAIFDTIPDMFFRLSHEGRILDYKAGNTSDLLIERNKMIGKMIFDIPYKTVAEQFREALDQVKEKRTLVTIEYAIPAGQGENFYEARFLPFLKDQTIVIVRNVTEHKMAEAALFESEEKYRALVEESSFGLYIIQDGLLRFVNKRFCEIIGYDYSEIVDRMSLEDFVLSESLPTIETSIERLYIEYVQSESLAFKIRSRDGEIHSVEAVENMILFKGWPAISTTFIDVTKEKALEQQLLQSKKMEALGTLVGGIAHDFNNFLTPIIGYGNLIQMALREGDPLRRYADQILTISKRAAKLVSNLLLFSRKQPIESTPHNMNDIIREAELFLKPLIKEDIYLEIFYAAEDLTILTDKTLFSQVLINLVTNANDAMPAGGRLTIKTERTVIDELFIKKMGYGIPGIYAVLSVSDTGVGMDEKTKEKVFEPFFTTKGVGKGTGLGLPMVYGIVEQHNGFLHVESSIGSGTTFKLYFPYAKEKGIGVAKTDEPSSYQKGAETILIAEDNIDLRRLIKEVLTSAGYTVIDAGDGKEAIKRLDECKGMIQLLILDVVMPGANGMEVHQEAIKRMPNIKTLFISGYMKDQIILKGITDDIAILEKPFTPERLLIKVREMLT